MSIERLERELVEAKQLIEADNKYIKRLERALAYAKKCLTPEQIEFGKCLTEIERLERG